MKVLALTSIRSDYDLMSGLYKSLHNDPFFDIGLLVFGAHLSKTLGESLDPIGADSIPIVAKIESLIDSDSHSARLKSASIALMNSIDIVRDHAPDLILYAGDREDVFIGALLGGYLQIPTAHFFAGDHSPDGHIDNPVRHASSKLSTFCFASTSEHAARLRSIGEEPERIMNVGSIALDRFLDEPRSSLSQISDRYGFALEPKQYALVIFHPIEEEIEQAQEILTNIISQLLAAGLTPVVGAPNTDPGHGYFGRVRTAFADNFRVHFYNVLPREDFLSLFENSAAIVGNSSAGILEAATLNVPCVNVGLRQRGRLAGDNIIFSGTESSDIAKAIQRVQTPEFKAIVECVENPYGDGNSVSRVVSALKEINFPALLMKKTDPIDMLES